MSLLQENDELFRFSGEGGFQFSMAMDGRTDTVGLAPNRT